MVRRTNDFRDKSDVLRVVNDPKNNINFVNIVFTDILGKLKYVSIPSQELNDILNEGLLFDGSIIDGDEKTQESNLIYLPDPKTMKILPCESTSVCNEEKKWKEAIIIANIKTLNNEQYSCDSRYILSKIIEKASETFKIDDFKISGEIEFHLLPQSILGSDLENLKNISNNLFNENKITQQKLLFSKIRKDIIHTLKDMGIDCLLDYQRKNIYQQMIVLKETDILNFADNFMIFKEITKLISEKYGYYATFMPKTFNNYPGSGLHLLLSLYNKNKNLFYDDKDEKKLSLFGNKFIAGLLKYSDEYSIITNQWTNSYKRLSRKIDAPFYKTWGTRNKNSFIKIVEPIISNKDLKFELRWPDPSCNIYLTLALIISSGLQGVKDNEENIKPIEKNVLTLEENQLKDIKIVPNSLREAVSISEKSKLVPLSIGHITFKKIILNKIKEIEYLEENDDNKELDFVSDFEKKYFLSKL
jgi:glutamine synthetase